MKDFVGTPKEREARYREYFSISENRIKECIKLQKICEAFIAGSYVSQISIQPHLLLHLIKHALEKPGF